ncbi:hypothetical protein EMCG_01474 [[Emmonsia] crescens]|uniref:Yeast cell wall synthesis Kre9/Knh1-like N-terminal domain-containing protein n=1 Tax=[Emmonsia] crescens TaxID=73230 RepID=A0A0G2J2L6_9EURO|nr:hypothetical protein EMCG_01474 [Emmonsia crescens UAMH 3008]
MHLIKSLLASALLVAAAVAQGISFTSFPEDVQAGKSVTVTWTGGSDEPVTITLVKGLSSDLQDVETLTTTGSDGSYTWTPESTIVNGNDYALKITQGEDFNYTNQFGISGGSETPTTTPTITSSPSSTPSSTPSSGRSSGPSSGPSNSRNSTTSTTRATTITTGVTVTPSGPTTAPPAPTATPASALSISAMSSPFALIMGVLAAFVYLH